MRKDKKWVFHSSLSRITGLTVTVMKQYTSRRDDTGLPHFHLGPNRTEELARQLGERRVMRQRAIKSHQAPRFAFCSLLLSGAVNLLRYDLNVHPYTCFVLLSGDVRLLCMHLD